MADIDPALVEQILDIAQRPREAAHTSSLPDRMIAGLVVKYLNGSRFDMPEGEGAQIRVTTKVL